MGSLHPDTWLVTPTEWTTAGRVHPGDFVFSGASGKPVEVTEVSRARPAWAAKFKIAGRLETCSVDHDLAYGSLRKSLLPREVPGRWDWGTKRVALDLPDSFLDLDPWVYGWWRMAGIDDALPVPDDLEDEFETRLQIAGLDIVRRTPSSGSVFVKVGGLMERLHRIGAFHSPGLLASYRRAGYEQRQDLIAGVLDARGVLLPAEPRWVRITQANVGLNEHIAEVATSLGWLARVRYGSLTGMRVSTRDAQMELRSTELAEFVARGGSTGRIGMYSVNAAGVVPLKGEEFVNIRTADQTYMVGFGMVPVWDDARA